MCYTGCMKPLKNVIMIANVGRNRELGCNNDLIWKFKEDLGTFRKITMGHPMVMGLNTWRSLPGMLPGRKHIVISDTPFDHPAEVVTLSSIHEFEGFAAGYGKDIYVIGGGMIYSQLLPLASKMILTEVDADAPDAVVFFPKFDKSDWDIVEENKFTDPDSGIAYVRRVYNRL